MMSKISSSYNVFHLEGCQQNMNQLGWATNEDLQRKKIMRKLKTFLVPILQKKVGEINTPNFSSL